MASCQFNHPSPCTWGEGDVAFSRTGSVDSMDENTASFEVVYEGFVYRTLHQHLVDSREYANEAGRFRKVNDGWEVSPANEDSVKVCAQHAWGAHLLVFADGSTYVTASGPDYVHKYIPGSVPFF